MVLYVALDDKEIEEIESQIGCNPTVPGTSFISENAYALLEDCIRNSVLGSRFFEVDDGGRFIGDAHGILVTTKRELPWSYIANVRMDSLSFGIENEQVFNGEGVFYSLGSENRRLIINGDHSTACVSAKQSIAEVNGFGGLAYSMSYYGVSISKGGHGVSVSTGSFGVSTTSGNGSIAVSSKIYSIAQSNFSNSVAISTGCSSYSVCNGDWSASFNHGHFGNALSSGKGCLAISSGVLGYSSVSGENGVAASFGGKGKVKGDIGSTLISLERGKDGAVLSVAHGVVDGKNIMPNMWYMARNGKLIKAD